MNMTPVFYSDSMPEAMATLEFLPGYFALSDRV